MDQLFSTSTIGNPKVILNLTKSPDRLRFSSISYVIETKQFEMEGAYGFVYALHEKPTQQWLRSIFQYLETLQKDKHIPILVHCNFGKDRTGVVIACLLSICLLGSYDEKGNFTISNEDSRRRVVLEWIYSEYCLSNGLEEESKKLMKKALEFLLLQKGVETFFYKISLEKIYKLLY